MEISRIDLFFFFRIDLKFEIITDFSPRHKSDKIHTGYLYGILNWIGLYTNCET